LSGRLVYASKDEPSLYDDELRYTSEAQRLTVYVPAYWKGKFEVTEKGRQIEISSKASSGSGKNGMLASIYVYTDAELQELGGAEEIPYTPIGSANGRFYFYTAAKDDLSGYEAGDGGSELFYRLLFGVPYVIGHLQFAEG
jgi:hypothetical protein